MQVLDSEPVLIVNNLNASFMIGGVKTSIVDNVSFKLYPGKTLAIVGESGSGKTTLALALLNALLNVNALKPEGEILYKGRNLLTLSKSEWREIRGSKMTMVFQDPSTSLNPVFKIGDQIIEVLFLHTELDDDEAYEKCLEMLREVQLPNPEVIMEKYPHELSGGQKQRVMIAMAMIAQPDILIADEPTTALDATIQAGIIDLIKRLQEKHRMATLLITHDMGIVAEAADDVMVMYASQAVEIGPKDDVLRNPTHPYTQALIATLPIKNKELKSIPGQIPLPNNKPTGCLFNPRCPFAFERCTREKVPLYEIKNQKTRCFLYDPNQS